MPAICFLTAMAKPWELVSLGPCGLRNRSVAAYVQRRTDLKRSVSESCEDGVHSTHLSIPWFDHRSRHPECDAGRSSSSVRVADLHQVGDALHLIAQLLHLAELPATRRAAAAAHRADVPALAASERAPRRRTAPRAQRTLDSFAGQSHGCRVHEHYSVWTRSCASGHDGAVADELLRVIGGRVRALRRDLGISQEELAARAGLHRNHVGGVERGERDIGIVALGRLTAALRMSLAEFFAPFRSKAMR